MIPLVREGWPQHRRKPGAPWQAGKWRERGRERKPARESEAGIARGTQSGGNVATVGDLVNEKSGTKGFCGAKGEFGVWQGSDLVERSGLGSVKDGALDDVDEPGREVSKDSEGFRDDIFADAGGLTQEDRDVGFAIFAVHP